MPMFTVDSELAVAPQTLWNACTLANVNWELSPLVRMTAPVEWRRSSIADWPVDRPLFVSWILLGGIVPIDRHSFRLVPSTAEFGFCERSSSWFNRTWQHERTIVPVPGGCKLSDRVAVEGRVPWLTAALVPVYRMVFRHRHRKLRKKYSQLPAAAV